MEQKEGKVCLVEVPIEKTFLFQDQIIIDKNLSTLRDGLSYRFSQNFINPQQKIMIVCPPTYALKELDTKKNNNKLFDGKGYIKAIPKAEYPFLIAQQSGMRSSIIQWNGKNYRLKGCGNGNDGFTLRKFEGDIDNLYEIRGCCFDHTVKRELFMNRKVEQILKKYNIETGNISIGYWQYGDIESINQNLEKNLQNQISLIPKYCGIYETIGDFRLGTHLLQGLRFIVNSNISNWCLDDIRRLITVQSRIVENRKSYNGNSWDLNNTQYRERPDGTIFKEDDYKNNRVFDWEKEQDNISITQNLTGKTILQNISILYQRIGYEIGKIKRIFIDNDINWGYFRDHSKFYYCKQFCQFIYLIKCFYFKQLFKQYMKNIQYQEFTFLKNLMSWQYIKVNQDETVFQKRSIQKQYYLYSCLIFIFQGMKHIFQYFQMDKLKSKVWTIKRLQSWKLIFILQLKSDRTYNQVFLQTWRAGARSIYQNNNNNKLKGYYHQNSIEAILVLVKSVSQVMFQCPLLTFIINLLQSISFNNPHNYTTSIHTQKCSICFLIQNIDFYFYLFIDLSRLISKIFQNLLQVFSCQEFPSEQYYILLQPQVPTLHNKQSKNKLEQISGEKLKKNNICYYFIFIFNLWIQKKQAKRRLKLFQQISYLSTQSIVGQFSRDFLITLKMPKCILEWSRKESQKSQEQFQS
ncbi:unnamed protein product [Paramecium pentaurelia]|uniref:Uncharacterized protein n=1 Tax=Paramecium pentaurelia TaxID=43138 RepID=A0A8S1WPI9_9CILI|nr:unnamed protein product [Paramecium pentaurelia]